MSRAVAPTPHDDGGNHTRGGESRQLQWRPHDPVVGASGALGLEICRQLHARSHTLRALVREGSSRANDLAALSAEIVRGDLKDASSIARARQGLETVISTATATTRQGPGDTLSQLQQDLPRPLTSVRDFVRQSIA
jgi:uncharacterized protein YbjT (DUF2867 family)